MARKADKPLKKMADVVVYVYQGDKYKVAYNVTNVEPGIKPSEVINMLKDADYTLDYPDAPRTASSAPFFQAREKDYNLERWFDDDTEAVPFEVLKAKLEE